MTPLDEAAIRAKVAAVISLRIGLCVPFDNLCCELSLTEILGLLTALDQVRREEYRRGQDEEAAKHADCCVDREELDQLRRERDALTALFSAPSIDVVALTAERDALRLRMERVTEALTDLLWIHGCIGVSAGMRMLCTCHSTHRQGEHKARLAKIRAALTPDAGRERSAASV